MCGDGILGLASSILFLDWVALDHRIVSSTVASTRDTDGMLL